MIGSERLLKEGSEQDHTCEFCYYEFFDDKAYPCSRCVCNQPTENLWRAKVKDEPHRLSNREWKEFLAEQFGVSKATAKEMLHGMMRWKKEDNFKRTFNPRKDKPQLDCKACRHNESGWYEKGSLSCERCCGDNFEFYEPKDDPQKRSK